MKRGRCTVRKVTHEKKKIEMEKYYGGDRGRKEDKEMRHTFGIKERVNREGSEKKKFILNNDLSRYLFTSHIQKQ